MMCIALACSHELVSPSYHSIVEFNQKLRSIATSLAYYVVSSVASTSTWTATATAMAFRSKATPYRIVGSRSTLSRNPRASYARISLQYCICIMVQSVFITLPT
jgi:hypothetical protein